MNRSDLFYQHYDDLYFSKNYAKEADQVMSIVKKYYPGKVMKALEIGAGTGNHTREFAKKRINLTSLDIDKKMIDLAAKKIQGSGFPNVKLLNVSVEELGEKDFDFAVAGFNVVNYLPDFYSLISFFKAVNSGLKPGGLLIFDCWNGAAALMDPPKMKTIHCRSGEKYVHCTVNSETNFMKQKTKLSYHLSIKNSNGKEIDQGVFSFEQMLWTPMELDHCIKDAAMDIRAFSRPFLPDISANEKDWKVMYICQKKK